MKLFQFFVYCHSLRFMFYALLFVLDFSSWNKSPNPSCLRWRWKMKNVHINKTLHSWRWKRWKNMSFLSLTGNTTLWIWHWRRRWKRWKNMNFLSLTKCSLSLTDCNTFTFLLSVSNYIFSKKPPDWVEDEKDTVMKDENKTQMQWNETQLQWNLLYGVSCSLLFLRAFTHSFYRK